MIPVILLLVLALAALGVWWNVFRDAEAMAQDTAAACSTAAEAPPSLDPTTVELRVLNATDTAGLAQTVATTLQSRGFVVTEIANDPSGRDVTGVGELRFGARGASTANYVGLYLPGATDYPDTRTTAVVDVVIGPEYADLATQDQVAAALGAEVSASAAC
jgi:hypothetical protein